MKGCVGSYLFSLFVVMGCNGKGSKWKLWDHTVHLKNVGVLRKCRCDVTMSSNALYHKGIIFHEHINILMFFFFTTIVIMVLTEKSGCKC